MFSGVLCHISVNELHTRKSGRSSAYNITDGGYDYFGLAPDLDDLNGYASLEEYKIENLCEQKAAWDIIGSLKNLSQLLKGYDAERLQEHFYVGSCAPYLKTVENVADLSDKERVLWNALPVALKSGYLVVSEPKETTSFGWEYDRVANCFRPSPSTNTLKSGNYSIEDGAIRANSCITAIALLHWMTTVEENTIRDINKTAQLMGKAFPIPDGWTVSFISKPGNNLFQCKGRDKDALCKATTKITVIGTRAEIEQLDSFLQERNLPTGFKKRVVDASVVEEAAAQEQLGALFSGAVEQNKRPYGIFMLPAWLSITGCKYEAISWSQMRHWMRLPVSTAVDQTAQYLRVLKSVKCYVAAPSQSGGYLVATSAGFFFVDDMLRPSTVQYRTLEELNLLEGFSDYSKFSITKELGKAQDVQSIHLTDDQQYLCQLRAYYLIKHPLSDYGEIKNFLKGASMNGIKILNLLWTYDVPGIFMPAGVFKGTEWSSSALNAAGEERTIPCYLQSVMHKMLISDQAMFFKDGKFASAYADTYGAFMTSIKDELKDLFMFTEKRDVLKQGGFNESKHYSKTLDFSDRWMFGRVAFKIPRPF